MRLDGPLPAEWAGRLSTERLWPYVHAAIDDQTAETRDTILADPVLDLLPIDGDGFQEIRWYGLRLVRVHWSRLIVFGQG